MFTSTRYGGYSGRYGCRNDRNGMHESDIPSFQGKNDPGLYLDWEKKMELLFDCHSYLERKKVKVATIGFCDDVFIWRNQFMYVRRCIGEQIKTGSAMKRVLKRKHVPYPYQQELEKKLRMLRQGDNGIDDYYNKLIEAMRQVDVEEYPKEMMDRFLMGLRMEIQERMTVRAVNEPKCS